MGLLSGLFGGGSSNQVTAIPVIPKAWDTLGVGNYTTTNAKGKKVTANNLLEDLKAIRTRGQEAGVRSGQLGQQVPGLLQQLGQAPTLQGQDQAEMDIATSTFQQMLQNAQLNAFNSTQSGILGANAGMSMRGIAQGGSSANALKSSVIAAEQSNLNNYANQASGQLLQIRSNLLNNVYQRLMNQYQGTASQQAQQEGMAQSAFGTVQNANASRAGYLSNIESANAANIMGAQQANQSAALQEKASGFAGLTGLLSGIGGIVGAFKGR